MNQIISNNDARLFVEIGGVFRKVEVSELEFNISFSPQSYSILGDYFERNFVSQGSIDGSFKVVWKESNDIVTKFFEKLATPKSHHILNGHRIKIVNLHPDKSGKTYREITCKVAIVPSGSTVTSDLSSPAFLEFDIAYQGDYQVRFSDDLDDAKIPSKVFFDTAEAKLTKVGTKLKLENAKFILLDGEGNISTDIEGGYLHLYLLKAGETKPIISVLVDNKSFTHFTNVATQQVKIEAFGDCIFNIPSINNLEDLTEYQIKGVYEYYDKYGTVHTNNLIGTNVVTSNKAGIYIPSV